MTKRKKIILISLAVTLALVMSVGGLAHAVTHLDVGGNKLIGTGEMGTESESYGPVIMHSRSWDTQFIVTNPNCDMPLTIHWVALIAGEDIYVEWDGNGPYWYAEQPIHEGPPEIWGGFVPEVLTPHEVWQFSIADFIAALEDGDGRGWVIEGSEVGKYSLEITWSGARYWQWWRWAEGRPLTGWAKEKCWYVFQETMDMDGYWDFGMAISEAEMELFRSRIPFAFPDL